MSKNQSVAVVIGRWQLPHLAHKHLLDKAFEVAEQVVVVIGSAFRSRNPKNPFREFERKEMLQRMLNAEQLTRVAFLYVRDYFDDTRWINAVKQGVRSIHGEKQVTLVGFKKDESSYYLSRFPTWDFVDAGKKLNIDATELRNTYFGPSSLGAALDVMKPYVHPNVLDYLQAWASLARYRRCRDEHQAVVEYKARYTGPFYLTADSLLEVNEHILLIRRGGVIGKGQVALPGGFVDKGEMFYNAALRELAEETSFRTMESTMAAALKSSAVFDHPGRSPRGRLITQAFHFKMSLSTLPDVIGSDDAKEAFWCPISKLSELEPDLFEDHATIIDHFIGFIDDKAIVAPALAAGARP